MANVWEGQPSGNKASHANPVHAVALTAPPQHAAPNPPNSEPKRFQGPDHSWALRSIGCARPRPSAITAPCSGMGSCMRRRSSAFGLPSASPATSCASYCRSTVNFPARVFAQLCVKPRKSKVSGLPPPRRFRFGRQTDRTRSGASCRGAAPDRTSRIAPAAPARNRSASDLMLESHDEVIGKAHDDHVAARVLLTPSLDPEVEHVVQIDDWTGAG